MSELERSLADLGDHLDAPAGHVARQAATSRLSRIAIAEPRSRRSAWAVAAVAAAVGALGAGLGLSPALAERLGLRGVEVRYADGPAASPPAIGLSGLGEPLALADAEERAGFPILVPSELGAPDAVYHHGPAVSLAYAPRGDLLPTPSGFAALVTEIPGRVDTAVVRKLLHAGSSIREIVIEGRRALWITGAPHDVLLPTVGPSSPRAAGNVLVWQREDLTVRLESSLDLERSIAVLRSLR